MLLVGRGQGDTRAGGTEQSGTGESDTGQPGTGQAGGVQALQGVALGFEHPCSDG